eukprot:1389538-Amphidinium_carterae.1
MHTKQTGLLDSCSGSDKLFMSQDVEQTTCDTVRFFVTSTPIDHTVCYSFMTVIACTRIAWKALLKIGCSEPLSMAQQWIDSASMVLRRFEFSALETSR